MKIPPKKLRELKIKDGAYTGVGMLVDCPDLGCQFLVVAPNHEMMQRAAGKLSMNYDTKKAANLKITQA